VTLRLVRVPLPEVPWSDLDDRPDRTVFQTRDWLDVLHETQGAEAVVARVQAGERVVGWFTGAVVRRYGVRILGSPLPGWTTSYMGFNLDDPGRYPEALDAVRRFAFGPLGCLHLELMDRAAPVGGPLPAGFTAGSLPGFELALDRSDDELLAAMTPHGRRDVRRSGRNGITVEEVPPGDHDGFVEEYYAQVSSAFAKRGLAPTYPPERVAAVLRHLDHRALLVLRARTSDGVPAATGIFPGRVGGTAVFWMGASDRDLQRLLPNEALMGHALRSWRDRGAVRFDFGGGGTYKAKYGGTPIAVPWLRSSRLPAIERARGIIRRRARSAQRGGVRGGPGPGDAGPGAG